MPIDKILSIDSNKIFYSYLIVLPDHRSAAPFEAEDEKVESPAKDGFELLTFWTMTFAFATRIHSLSSNGVRSQISSL